MTSTISPATIIPADPVLARHRLARLEDELTTLTGHINAAREKVRVARALVDLPKIRESFETGALSYSRFRAMTRIAMPANEDVLLAVARHGTTQHVETLVSKWLGAERSREVQRAGRQQAVRSVRWHYDDGCPVIRERLPPEQGALVIEALQAALDRLEEGDEAYDGQLVQSAHSHAKNPAVEDAAEETAQKPVREAAHDERGNVSYMVRPAFARAERAGRQGRMRSYIRPVIEARTPRALMEIRHTRTDQLNGLAGHETSQVACVPVRPVKPSNYALSVQSMIWINDDELAECQAGWG